MIEARMEAHIKQHVEVLQQYLSNDTTDHPTLAGMVVRILIKFFKKAFFEHALDIWFEVENLQPVEKIGDKIKTLRSLLERKFDKELIDMIIDDITKYYKIKLAKNAG